jgi:membrane protease subunit HflK
MAWNEPGGPNSPDGNRNSDRGGDRNPWGKRPQQGPPDLDEVVRNLKRKLAAMFGGGAGNGAGSGPRGDLGGGIGAGVVLGVLAAIWLLTGIYTVGQAERAVILRFGKFLETTQAGLRWHMPWPIDSKVIVNVERIDSYSDQTRMLTADENMVDINLAVQFRRSDPKLYVFNVRDPDATLREVSESAIREIVGRSNLGKVLESGRQEIAASTKDLIQRTLNSYNSGLEVTSVNLQGVSVPEQVAPAQQDAIKAGNDKERFTLEARTYADDILPKARGAAARELQDAQAYRARKVADSEGETQRFTQLLKEYERAPGVTRQRLYLETVQGVYANSKKVIVDTKSGSNNMLYIPIDKMMEQSRGGVRETSRDSVVVTRPPASAPSGTTPEVTVEDRRVRGSR